jgi:hypothetical protein
MSDCLEVPAHEGYMSMVLLVPPLIEYCTVLLLRLHDPHYEGLKKYSVFETPKNNLTILST